MAVLLAMQSATPLAWALPQGVDVEHGTASLDTLADGTLQITASDQAVVRWQSFDIAPQETVRFLQPSSSASVLNRVTGGATSQIAGTLTANGLLILINPAGMLFAPSAVVDVGGLIASSLDLATQDFLDQRYRFLQPDGAPSGAVVNRGTLRTTGDGGVIALLGGAVANAGSITARLGTVALAAGARTTLSFEPDGRIAVVVDAPTSALVLGPDGQVTDAAANTGVMSAAGGFVLVSASAAAQIFERAVNHTGVIEATAIEARAGRIVLTGGGGDVRVAGTLRADGGATGPGGEIQVRALDGDVMMAPEAVVDLRGGAAGGPGGVGELSATGNAIVGGTVLGDAAAGFARGTFAFDPTDLTISSNTTVTTDTTYFADRDVKIEANVTANNGASLAFLADHDSATLQDWDNGSGKVTQKNGKVVTTTGGGSVTMAGKSFSLANNGINASGPISFYYNDDAVISQQSDLVNKIVAFSGALGLYATGELKLGDHLDNTALFDGTNALRLESDSDLGGQAADVVNFNGKDVNTRGGNLTVVSRGTNATALTALNAGTGTVDVTAAGGITDGNGATLNVTGGAVTLTAQNGGIDTDVNASTSVTATSSAANGALDLATTSGDLKLAALNAGTGAVTLTAAGALTDTNGSATNVAAGTLTATAATGIDLDTAVDSITASVTGTGTLDFSDTGALTVTSATTADGALTITSGGTMTVGSVRGTSVTLTASGDGSILSTGGTTNVTATTGATLTAGGTIGTATTPITVSVLDGALTVIPSGISDGVSANLTGTVSPSNNLEVPQATRGRVVFNERQRFPLPSVLSDNFQVLSVTLTELVQFLGRLSLPRRL
ncbi:MAG: filamentous hemagglutinin N-terminal domain-containing protein [Candidatus Omnitrophica bacterium]|nr:filamentous hemagglutinin N-terminal domain-containing protein [Candidatus Omnitrophota bacterium]